MPDSVNNNLNTLLFLGYGVEQWPTGHKYEGEWSKGERSGYGVYWKPIETNVLKTDISYMKNDIHDRSKRVKLATSIYITSTLIKSVSIYNRKNKTEKPEKLIKLELTIIFD